MEESSAANSLQLAEHELVDGGAHVFSELLSSADSLWLFVDTLVPLVLFTALFVIARWILDKITDYDIAEELTQKDNAALALAYAGYFLAVTIIFIGAVIGPEDALLEQGLLASMGEVALYTLIGIGLLLLSRVINDKLILHTFSVRKEIITDKNAGTGAVQFGSYVASGLIVAGSIHGVGGGIETALAFFVLGQIALVLFARVYNLITPFDVHEEIEKDNVAAGVAFGGTLIALGIILMNAASGDFISWPYNLMVFVEKTVLACLLLPVFRIVLDKLFIRNSDLNEEISRDQNLGAGILEMTNAIGFSVLLYFLLA